jgi:Domain of unknown function (DUF6457)
MTTTAEWVSAYAEATGIAPPSQDDINSLLQLAGVAAHASERTAAPITCWIAATAGLCACSRRVDRGRRDLTRGCARHAGTSAGSGSSLAAPEGVTADRISALGLPWSG